MKDLLSRATLTWFLVVAIACGAVAVGWIVFAGSPSSSNSVHIETAGVGAGKAGKGATGAQVASRSTSKATATTATLSLGTGKSVDIPADGDVANMAVGTPQVLPSQPTTTSVMIVVYITGAVAKPGVYSLPEGSRVQDAINAAGGAMIQADLEGINLAERLTDEAHVMISRKDNATPSTVQQPAASIAKAPSAPIGGQSAPAAAKSVPTSPVNINTATSEQLQTLPGIGPSIAARIISDREANGPFKTIEDLTRIAGIKEGIMSKIRAYITVGK